MKPKYNYAHNLIGSVTKKAYFFTFILSIIFTGSSWAGMIITSEDIPLEEGIWSEFRIEKSGRINDDYKIIRRVEGRKALHGYNAFVVKEQEYEGLDSWSETYSFKDENEYIKLIPDDFLANNPSPDNIEVNEKLTLFKFPLIIGKEWVDSYITIQAENYHVVFDIANQVVSQEEVSVGNETYNTLKIKREYRLIGYENNIAFAERSIFTSYFWISKDIGTVKISMQENTNFDITKPSTYSDSYDLNTTKTLLNYYIPSKTDSDNDAVFDNLDQCPDTPPNTTVDAAGCPTSEPQNEPVPTLSQWGILVLSLLIIGLVRKRKNNTWAQ
jgi:hypothetical protein